MDDIRRATALLRRSLHGDAWHGSSLDEALAGVDAFVAAARPIDGAHSIWEIVLHLTGWAREVAKRLRGSGEPTPPVRGDWPSLEAATEEAWTAARVELRLVHEKLLEALEAFPRERLHERVGGERDAPLGTGVTYLEMIDGILQHDAYHTGQIALLKKAPR